MELQELTPRLKQLEKVIIVLTIIMAICIVYLLWPRKGTISANEQQLVTQIAVMQAHDRYRDSISIVYQQQRIQDSIRIEGIKTQVNNVPALVTRINNQYNDKRSHIINLSADQQLQLFSEWLSTQDSL